MKIEKYQFVGTKKFNPKDLFKNGEQGVWYNPSDISRYMSNLGPELVVNGTFNTDTAWTKGAGWSISAGVATASASPSNVNLLPISNMATVAGKSYIAVFDVVSVFSGGFTLIAFNGSSNIGSGTVKTSAGTGFSFVFTATNTTTKIYVTTNGITTGSVDNISVKEIIGVSTATLFQDSAGTIPVTSIEQPVGLMIDKSRGAIRGPELLPNGDFSSGATGWSIPAGWLLTGSTCTATAATDSLKQIANPYIAGKFYEVTFDLTHTSGLLYVRVGVGTAVTFNTSGRKRVILMANGTNGIEFYGGAVSGVVDNISVKEVYGNHAYQTTAIDRPILSARVNQFIDSENFAGVWVSGKSAGATVTQNTTIAPNGTLTADTVSFATSGDYLYYAFANYNTIAGKGVTVISHCKTPLQIFVFGGATPAGADVFSAVDIGGGWYKHTLTRTFSVTTANLTLQVLPSGSIVGAGSYAIWGADLRPSDQASLPYQRVDTSTVYDSDFNKFPVYLACNGTNTGMRTNNIKFNSDKLTGFIGVRMLAGSPMQMLVESSTTYSANTGAFELALNELSAGVITPVYKSSSGPQYKMNSSNVTPRSVVATFQFDTALTVANGGIVFRENGTALAGSDIGTSTGTIFGNYPLYLFSRAGTSLPFNGNFYGLILRGVLTNNKQIRETEKYLTKKLG